MSASCPRRLIVAVLLLAVGVAPVMGGDREVAELLFEKGEKAFRKREYESAASFYERALAEAIPYPEAAFALGKALEKLGRAPDALQAYLKCRDQVKGMENPPRKLSRLADDAGKAVTRLGEGYATLADLDRAFVKDCIAFSKRYLKSSPGWAKVALEAAEQIEPGNTTVDEYLGRLAEVAAPSEGAGLYEPLILDDKLSDWRPGLSETFSCLARIITADTPPDEAKTNDLRIRFEGTWSLKASFRVLEKKGEKISHGMLFGRKPDKSAWGILVDWDDNLSLVRWAADGNYTMQVKKLTRYRGDRWHEIRIDVEPGKISAYFNGGRAFIHQESDPAAFDGAPSVFTQRGRFEIKDLGVQK